MVLKLKLLLLSLLLLVNILVCSAFGEEKPRALFINSLPNKFSLILGGKTHSYIKRTIKTYLSNTNVDYDLVHNLSQSELHSQIINPQYDFLFWIGHGQSAFQDITNKGLLYDSLGYNIAPLFKKFPNKFAYRSVIACGAGNILSSNSVQGYMPEKNILLQTGLRKSLKDFHKKFKINERCRIVKDFTSDDTYFEKCNYTKIKYKRKAYVSIDDSNNSGQTWANLRISMDWGHENIPNSLQVYFNKKLLAIIKQGTQIAHLPLPLGLVKNSRNKLIIKSGSLILENVNDFMNSIELASDIADITFRPFANSEGEVTLNEKRLFIQD